MPAVRTLLLTDIVDSTALAEALGDAATAALWEAHDRVARDLLAQHDGREIDKTDGFLHLFASVDAAVAYAVAYHRDVGNRRYEGFVLANLGAMHHHQGRMAEARAHYDDALVVHREVGDRRYEGFVLGFLGRLHHEQGRMAEARAHYDDALGVARELGDLRLEGWTIIGIARLAVAGDPEAAAAQLDYAEPLLIDVGDPALLTQLYAARSELRWYKGDPLGAREALAGAKQVAPAENPDAQEAIAQARALLYRTDDDR